MKRLYKLSNQINGAKIGDLYIVENTHDDYVDKDINKIEIIIKDIYIVPNGTTIIITSESSNLGNNECHYNGYESFKEKIEHLFNNKK